MHICLYKPLPEEATDNLEGVFLDHPTTVYKGLRTRYREPYNAITGKRRFRFRLQSQAEPEKRNSHCPASNLSCKQIAGMILWPVNRGDF